MLFHRQSFFSVLSFVCFMVEGKPISRLRLTGYLNPLPLQIFHRNEKHVFSLLLFQKPFQNLLPVVDEHGSYLIAVSLFIAARMDRTIIKAQDLSSRHSKKDW